MEIGKVPENVLKRSVMGQIHNNRKEVLSGSSVGEDCALLDFGEDFQVVTSTDPITGASEEEGRLAVHITANDLASSGAEPVAMLFTVLLPPDSDEALLKGIMKEASEEAESLNITIAGGHTEVTDAVSKPLLSVTGFGKVRKGHFIKTGGAKPGMDLIATKWIGLEGTSIIAREYEDELQQKFPFELVDTAIHFDKFISVVKDGLVAAKFGAAAMHDVTEGGIYGAIWEMCESSKVGCEVYLKDIPIKQETVEISEYFDIDPYRLISSGSMLIAANDGYGLVQELMKNGVEASVIGRTTENNDRLIINGERRRFLTPPSTDELYRVKSKLVDG